MMFSTSLLLWLLALELSSVVVLDGVVQVQVEAWLVYQDKAGHHIKAQGWDHQGSTIFYCECSTSKARGPELDNKSKENSI
jgi:hypothetical protein